MTHDIHGAPQPGAFQDLRAVLAAERAAFRERPPSPRLARFTPSERSIRLDDFDPARGPWPISGCHRKFRSALARHAAEVDPGETLVALFDFAPKAGGGFCARWILPMRFEPGPGLLVAAGPARPNPLAREAGPGAPAPPGSFAPSGEGYAVLVAEAADPLAASLDPARFPRILENRLVRALAGLPATAVTPLLHWDAAGTSGV